MRQLFLSQTIIILVGLFYQMHYAHQIALLFGIQFYMIATLRIPNSVFMNHTGRFILCLYNTGRFILCRVIIGIVLCGIRVRVQILFLSEWFEM